MKTLRLLLLGILTPLLCGSVFAFDLTNDDLNYINSVAYTSWSSSFNWTTNFVLYDHWWSWDWNSSICVLFHNYQDTEQIKFLVFGSEDSTTTTVGYNFFRWITQPYALYCRGMHPSWRYLIYQSFDNWSTSFDYYVVDAADIFNWNLWFDIAWLTSQLTSCQSNLSSCNTDKNLCLNDKSTLSWQLASCNEDKISLNNNIDSLTLQLQNCLGQSCQWSGDYGSWLFFNQYSLYRTDDEVDYSTPITNNLFLPLGYKWKINEDNILSISKINTLETAYQFKEEDKPVVINSMSIVMLFFLWTGLLILLIMYLRRFIHKKH